MQIKRIYEAPNASDGYRILVDRLWPRGVSKERAHIDLWLKEVAPSTELRKWFGHDVKKGVEFEKRYKKELEGNHEIVIQLQDVTKKHKHITLLYGARDTEHNEAVLLKEYLEKK